MFNYQWLILRLSALTTFLAVLVDMESMMFISGFLLLHISMGLSSVILDYIHISKIKLGSLMLIRISAIEVSSYILELLM